MTEQVFALTRRVEFAVGTGVSVRRQGAAPVADGEIEAPVVYLTEGEDKYSLGSGETPIDCEARLPLCHAACCTLRVPLTHQDLAEGVVEWDRMQPYLVRQGADGRCVHCEGERCTVYAVRPGLCRTYGCRGDDRIWVDFDRRIPNPALALLADDLRLNAPHE